MLKTKLTSQYVPAHLIACACHEGIKRSNGGQEWKSTVIITLSIATTPRQFISKISRVRLHGPSPLISHRGMCIAMYIIMHISLGKTACVSQNDLATVPRVNTLVPFIDMYDLIFIYLLR